MRLFRFERHTLEGSHREALALSLEVLSDGQLVVLDEELIKEGIFLVVLLQGTLCDVVDEVLGLTSFASLFASEVELTLLR